MLMTPAGAECWRAGISDGAAPVPSETGRTQRRVDGVMRIERAGGGRATGGGMDKPSERGREDKHSHEILSHLRLCLAFETQIKLLWKALLQWHQLPWKPDGWMLRVKGRG